MSQLIDVVPLRPPPASVPATILVASQKPVSIAFLLEFSYKAAWRAQNICGRAACIAEAETNLPDLAVIDGVQSLPFALDLLCAIRSHELLKPLGVMVLGKSDADELSLLEAGADDFIMMPLHRQKFLLRAEGIIRRTRCTKRFLRYADITMDVEEHRVFRGGVPIELGPLQFRLLRHFLANPERVFSHEQLGGVVWNDGASYRMVRTIYTYVHVLREQLNHGGKPDLIRTERGGYRMKQPASFENDRMQAARGNGT